MSLKNNSQIFHTILSSGAELIVLPCPDVPNWPAPGEVHIILLAAFGNPFYRPEKGSALYAMDCPVFCCLPEDNHWWVVHTPDPEHYPDFWLEVNRTIRGFYQKHPEMIPE